MCSASRWAHLATHNSSIAWQPTSPEATWPHWSPFHPITSSLVDSVAWDMFTINAPCQQDNAVAYPLKHVVSWGFLISMSSSLAFNCIQKRLIFDKKSIVPSKLMTPYQLWMLPKWNLRKLTFYAAHKKCHNLLQHLNVNIWICLQQVSGSTRYFNNCRSDQFWRWLHVIIMKLPGTESVL